MCRVSISQNVKEKEEKKKKRSVFPSCPSAAGVRGTHGAPAPRDARASLGGRRAHQPAPTSTNQQPPVTTTTSSTNQKQRRRRCYQLLTKKRAHSASLCRSVHENGRAGQQRRVSRCPNPQPGDPSDRQGCGPIRGRLGGTVSAKEPITGKEGGNKRQRRTANEF